MKSVPGVGALANLIPENKTGEKIVGGILGTREATQDFAVGTYNMFRHPINTFSGIARLGTFQGQVDASISAATNYVQSRSEFGEGFTNSRYISYGLTTIGLSIATGKVTNSAAGNLINAFGKIEGTAQTTGTLVFF